MAFTIVLIMEFNTSTILPSGVTFQDGQWDQLETFVTQAIQELLTKWSGGKTPGTPGDWTSTKTLTGMMATSNTASTETSTPTTSPSGDLLMAGPCTIVVTAMEQSQLTTMAYKAAAVDAVVDAADAVADAAVLHQSSGGKTLGTHGE